MALPLRYHSSVTTPTASTRRSTTPDPARTTCITKSKPAAPCRSKFRLGGDYGLEVFAPGYPAAQTVSCTTAGTIDPIEETPTAKCLENARRTL